MTAPQHAEGVRAGRRQSWLVGAALAVPASVLLLEFPIFGLVLLVVVAGLIARTGHAAAGVAGLVVGLGGTWFLLFGRVALACGEPTTNGGCEAPSIGAAVLASLAILAAGGVASALIAVRAWRA